ncbi:MAG: bifunctional biotin--[acetyl-CoA-carboxylase] ligase/biotin operon repressor BirA [Gammaproteobacteria bacterium]
MSTRYSILQVLQDGRFHSGEALGRRLGVSRAAIWKAVQSAGQLGIRIDAVSGRGYRLAEPLELLDRGRIVGALSPRSAALLDRLHLFDVVDSTNSYLMECAARGAGSGTVCLAESQRAGRGRRGRSWVSPYASNLYLSVLFRFAAGPQAVQGLSLALGVVVVAALQRLGIEGVQLKWPNDLVAQGAKLGGVLIEMAGEAGGPCHVVAGIGLNVCMPERAALAIDQAWIDLQHLAGAAQPSRNALAGAVLDLLLPALADYEVHGFAPYRERWRSLDALNGKPVTVHSPLGEVSGTGAGIDESGALRLRLGDSVQTFAAGEVTLRGAV